MASDDTVLGGTARSERRSQPNHNTYAYFNKALPCLRRGFPFLLACWGIHPTQAAGAPKVSPLAPFIDPDSLQFLKDLVEIPSGTSMSAGLEQMRMRIQKEFATLGMNGTLLDGSNGRKILVLERADAKPRILIIGHVDTVYNNPARVPKLITEDIKVKGPGVIDMKGGITVIHKALRELVAQGKSDILNKIKIVLNDDEETGSKDSVNVLLSQVKDCDAALIFEPGLSDGSLVTAHSGIKWLKMTVHGKAAHAGMEPEKGLNACVELGYKLVSLGSLSDYSKGLAVTPGVIEGGTTPNTVCETASVKIDVRYTKQEDLENVLREIRSINLKTNTANDIIGMKPSSDLEELVSIPPMSTEATRSLFDLARKVGASLRNKVTGKPVGYASDGNQLAKTGIRLLVGLGPYGGGMHSSEEFMDVRSFSDRVLLTKGLLEALAVEK
jgi:glutamate carboxypeptidase